MVPNKARGLLCSLGVVGVVLVALVAPVMATHVYLDEITGSYSLQLTTAEATIKLGGTNGLVNIDTDTPVYNDDFLMNAGGDFSVCHIARVSNLYREESLSGGGDIIGETNGNGTVTSYTFHGSTASLAHTRDFGNPVDPAWVNIQLLLNAEYAWVMFASDYDQEALMIQAFTLAYGLSDAEGSALFGLYGELSRFGYSAAEVIRLAHTRGIDYLRELLAVLVSPFAPSPIDKAAEKFSIPWNLARNLFREFGDNIFIQALPRSGTYKDFVANLKGFDIKVWAGSLFNKTEVVGGEEILAAFQLFHPDTGEQLFDPRLLPYANVAQVLPDGKLNGLAGYFSYIEFGMDEQTGVYYAPIKTMIDENNRLEPGEYYVFIGLRNPGNDTYSTIKASFTVTG